MKHRAGGEELPWEERNVHAELQTPVQVDGIVTATFWKGAGKKTGFLGDKSILPVSELRFGDTGGSVEQGFHTLGKFKCHGIA